MGNQQTFEKFDRFEDLPKPALQEILLKLNRQQLHAICSISRKAFLICSENNFRETYNNLHPKQMIYGNLSFSRYFKDFENSFIDDMLSAIRINYNEFNILNFYEYIGKSSSDNKNITFLSKSRVAIWDNGPYTREELLIRLSEIGKERWIDQFEYNENRGSFVFSKEVAREIWEILRKEISKIPKGSFVIYIKYVPILASN